MVLLGRRGRAQQGRGGLPLGHQLVRKHLVESSRSVESLLLLPLAWIHVDVGLVAPGLCPRDSLVSPGVHAAVAAEAPAAPASARKAQRQRDGDPREQQQRPEAHRAVEVNLLHGKQSFALAGVLISGDGGLCGRHALHEDVTHRRLFLVDDQLEAGDVFQLEIDGMTNLGRGWRRRQVEEEGLAAHDGDGVDVTDEIGVELKR